LCASHFESCVKFTILDALEISERLEATSLEDIRFEKVSLLEDSVADDSIADDPAATGIGLLPASSLHAANGKTEIDASIASTEA
jgi:hypothetical protein